MAERVQLHGLIGQDVKRPTARLPDVLGKEGFGIIKGEIGGLGYLGLQLPEQ